MKKDNLLARTDPGLRCRVKIRAFDGSRYDAEGIIAVDRATFGDCPYTAEEVLALESDPGQYAWVAEERGQIVGFVSAFATCSLETSRWEVDELAVHPQSQGRGAGTALVTCAVERGIGFCTLAQARALVATDNHASARVFSKCGFVPVSTVHLMVYSIEGREPCPRRDGWPAIRLAQPDDRFAIARLSQGNPARIAKMHSQPTITYLVAGPERKVKGYVELIHVRTLQYEGFWLESMAVLRTGHRAGDRRVVSALLDGAIEETKRHESLDEMGQLIPTEETSLYEAAVGAGLKDIGKYRIFVRDMCV
jgi:ribosomal protein S18 acetylase RimI-like enzyme